MFAEENKKLIEQAIKNELEKISKEHGEKYNTPHEGYAVLLEEVEEAKDYLKVIKKQYMVDLWSLIKGNLMEQQHAKWLGRKAINLALEAVQIAAVCEKFQRGTVNR